MANIIETVRGDYGPVGDMAGAELAVGDSFGKSQRLQGVNGTLGQKMLDEVPEHVPMMADLTLATAFPEHDRTFLHVVGGPVATTFHKNVGSEGVVRKALEIMKENDWRSVAHYAHAGHIGQIVVQTEILAHKMGMKDIEIILPPGLPYFFDADSGQWWTSREELWVPRATTYLSVLKAQRQLQIVRAALSRTSPLINM